MEIALHLSDGTLRETVNAAFVAAGLDGAVWARSAEGAAPRLEVVVRAEADDALDLVRSVVGPALATVRSEAPGLPLGVALLGARKRRFAVGVNEDAASVGAAFADFATALELDADVAGWAGGRWVALSR